MDGMGTPGMAPQVSTTRASRSPSLGLSLPGPLKGSARDKGSKTPRPSRLWREELSGLASQRAAATGRGPDPDRHGARRAAPRRAGALTARRDAKPTSLRGTTFLMAAILAQLPPRASAEPHVTGDRRPPRGRVLALRAGLLGRCDDVNAGSVFQLPGFDSFWQVLPSPSRFS